MPLDPQRLTTFLGYPADQPVTQQQSEVAESMAVGWLSEATGLDAWPDPVPKIIDTWILELAAIAFENPTSMEDDQAGEVRSGWRDRRSQILAQARAWSARNGHAKPTGSSVSRGCFPPVLPLPGSY